ncbi:hypothetical protein A5727_12670 [Mycobacterium sp. ACS4331]|nr:hypothetical protein A5727_12670 [Mycobacterium sp. ACS4331]
MVPDDVHGLVERAARMWPDKVGLIFPHLATDLTFGQINQMANNFADVLARHGIGSGAAVAVLLHNRPEFAGVWLAAAKLGAVMVPINTRFTESEVRYVVEHSGAALLVTEDDLASLVTECPIPVLDCREFVVPAAEEVERGALERAHHVDAATLLNIQYTSGTTAKPKGCLLPQGYWIRIAKEMTLPDPDGRSTVSIGHHDRFLIAQPMHYMDPQWHIASALMAGATLVILDGFHPSTFWDAIREHRVTIFYCLGAMPTLLLKMPAHADDHNHLVRAILCSAIPPELHSELERRWGAPWFELYGMTETGVDIRVRAAEHDELLGTACIGRPALDREAGILNDEGRPLPPDSLGELALRGPWMMDGYFRDPEATDRVRVDGWLRTGDLARMDEQGRIYFVGRAKHMIRRAGENISAAQVEEALVAHSDVIEAACVPVPDALRGEEVIAFLRMRDGVAADPEALAQHAGTRLAKFKVPRFWTFVDSFPRTASERVERRHLASGLGPGPVVYDRAEATWVESPFNTGKTLTTTTEGGI